MDRTSIEAARADVLEQDAMNAEPEKACGQDGAVSWGATPRGAEGLTMAELGMLLDHRGANERHAGHADGYQHGHEEARRYFEKREQEEVSSWARAILQLCAGEVADAEDQANRASEAASKLAAQVASLPRSPKKTAADAQARVVSEHVAALQAFLTEHRGKLQALIGEIAENGIRVR